MISKTFKVCFGVYFGISYLEVYDFTEGSKRHFKASDIFVPSLFLKSKENLIKIKEKNQKNKRKKKNQKFKNQNDAFTIT